MTMLEFFKGNCSNNMSKILVKKMDSIQQNIVPKEWWIRGSSINSTVLFDYLKSFLIKQDFLFNLIYERKCEISPILPLSKIYDPLDAITSFLLFYSRENKVNSFHFITF